VPLARGLAGTLAEGLTKAAWAALSHPLDKLSAHVHAIEGLD
jgi:hypothetical protein